MRVASAAFSGLILTVVRLAYIGNLLFENILKFDAIHRCHAKRGVTFLFQVVQPPLFHLQATRLGRRVIHQCWGESLEPHQPQTRTESDHPARRWSRWWSSQRLL